jgi:hypothetical protein
MDEMRQPEAPWRRSAREIPAFAWLLVAAAGIELLALAFSQGLFETQPFRFAVLVSVLTSATPFLLAAGIIAGARRWPSARPWLLVAAAAFTLRGVLDAGLVVWLASVQNLPADSIATWNGLMDARALAVGIIGVGAPALLAVGLWVPPRPSSPVSQARRLTMVALTGLGVVATVGGLLLAATPGGQTMPMPVLLRLLYIVTALALPAFTALAVAAVRAMPARDRLPELLMIAGVAVVLVATGWLDWLFSQRQLQELPSGLLGWLVTLPNGLVLVGLLAVAAGFAVAGLTESRAAQPHTRTGAQQA